MSNYMNSIPILKPKRSKFNLGYTHKTSCDMGQLIPIGSWICYPNEKYKIGNEAIIRLQPLVAPLMHRIQVKVAAFFVPWRIVWDEYEDWAASGREGEDLLSKNLPLWDDYYEAGTAPPKYSLWDYFARNTLAVNDATKDPDKNFVPNDLMRRAYNKIYNEYFINRNVQNADIAENNNDILYVNFKNDYFASALPFQQRGSMSAIAMSFNDAPIIWDKVDTTLYNNNVNVAAKGFYGETEDYQALMKNTGGIATTKIIPAYKDIAIDMGDTGYGFTVGTPSKTVGMISPNLIGKRVKFTNQARIQDQAGTYPDPNESTLNGQDITLEQFSWLNQTWQTLGMKADNSSLAAAFDAAELRMMLQTQKFLERNARVGSRYVEQIRGRWGIFAGDARIQRPEFIYSTTNSIGIEELPQLSEDGTTPQGHLVGKGIGAMANSNGGKYTTKEHGIIIQLMWIVPDLDYIPQGYDKETLIHTRLDEYAPEFQHLSEQMVKKGELYFAGNPATDNAMFGYEPIWSELRHRRNVVSGDMRDTFDYWHLGRKFSNQPALNEAFIKVDGTSAEFKRIFATGTTAQGFLIAFHNNCRALRPLSKYGEPGFVDHL